MPLSPAASSLADRPSTMKLFERLRWLPIDRLTPGTAEVSGKSCVLATLVGDTPGRAARARGSCGRSSGQRRLPPPETVAAIWLRAASSTVASPVTVTLVSIAPTPSVSGSSNAAPARELEPAGHVLEAVKVDDDFVGADAEVGKAEAARRVGDGRRGHVRLPACRAVTCAPGTTPPEVSTTRPLTLA